MDACEAVWPSELPGTAVDLAGLANDYDQVSGDLLKFKKKLTLKHASLDDGEVGQEKELTALFMMYLGDCMVTPNMPMLPLSLRVVRLNRAIFRVVQKSRTFLRRSKSSQRTRQFYRTGRTSRRCSTVGSQKE
ncbi:hypothetical protein BGZ94_006608 [Podila epigama]|nr:hypothetical protein BGZ94_006608 [Podila epigama]